MGSEMCIRDRGQTRRPGRSAPPLFSFFFSLLSPLSSPVLSLPPSLSPPHLPFALLPCGLSRCGVVALA